VASGVITTSFHYKAPNHAISIKTMPILFKTVCYTTKSKSAYFSFNALPDSEPSVLDNDLPNPYDFNNSNQLEANIEELEEADNREDTDPATPNRYIEPFPGPAGEALTQEKTRFENWEGELRLEGKTPWDPFASRSEWELAQWLMKNVGQRDFSKVNSRENLSFHNKYTFLKKVDRLPTGPEWVCRIITITGNLVDENGVPMEECVEVWRRDDCRTRLFG